MFQYFFSNYSEFISMVISVFWGVCGLVLLVQSLKHLIKNKNYFKYSKTMGYIINRFVLDLSIYEPQSFYKETDFFKLANKGLNPCEMKNTFKIDDSYITSNNNMYI